MAAEVARPSQKRLRSASRQTKLSSKIWRSTAWALGLSLRQSALGGMKKPLRKNWLRKRPHRQNNLDC